MELASRAVLIVFAMQAMVGDASRNHHLPAPKDGDAHWSHDKSVMVACGHEGLVDICRGVLEDGDDIYGGHACCGRGGGPFRARVHPHGRPIEYTPNWADPIAHDHDKGLTALHRAAAHGHLDIVNFLLNAGWTNDQRAENGELPSDAARRNGHVRLAEGLEELYKEEL
jgi:hypothetical protein